MSEVNLNLQVDTQPVTLELSTTQLNLSPNPTALNLYSGGPPGATGATGYTGSTGPANGYTGSAGSGYTGSQGIQGPPGGYTGSQGNQGIPGAPGTPGANGPTGYIGSAGINGYTGSTGAGYTGSASTQIGYTGSIGYVGSTGAGYTGSQGITGFIGSKGDPNGYTGSQGVIGYTGSIGPIGPIGFVGSKGDPNGYTGSQGATGYTGSAAATNQIVNGTSNVSINTSGGNVTVGVDGVANITTIASTGLSTQFRQFNERFINGGTVSGTITPDANSGTIYTYTLGGNITLNSITNVQTGTSMTIMLVQDGSGGRTLTSTMQFSRGQKTLTSAPGSTDIVFVFYNGTNYYASLSTSYG